MATETIAIYTLNFNHARNASSGISSQHGIWVQKLTPLICSMISCIRRYIVGQQDAEERAFAEHYAIAVVASDLGLVG